VSDDKLSAIKFIDRELRRIEVDISGLNISFPLNAIPDQIYEAIVNTPLIRQKR
jgi:hypothetical protein